MLGALFFGWLTDRLGRKKLFFITLSVYLTATAATALSGNLWTFALFRFFTGAGIGGEYAAINSTIQELIPARYRGWTDLCINGSFWIGAAIGAVGSIILLDPSFHRSGIRLAARLSDRRGARACDLRHAVLDSGKPALADDAWPRRGSRSGSSPISKLRSGAGAPTEALPRVRLQPRHVDADCGSRAHAVSRPIARALWSVLR